MTGSDGGLPPADAVWEVTTSGGLARMHHFGVPRGGARATLVLGHGAGRGVDARELVAIAASLPAADGVEVVLVEQPWHVAGRRVAGAPPTLDKAWTACLRDLKGRNVGVRRLVVGGRSAGARVACRTVAEVRPDALFLLAFPLRPVNRAPLGEAPPSRLPELVAAVEAVPTVIVQGVRDALGEPGEIALGLADAHASARILPVPHADHSFRVAARVHGGQEAALELIVRTARGTALRIQDGQY